MWYAYTPYAKRVRRISLLRRALRWLGIQPHSTAAMGRSRILPGTLPQESGCPGYHSAFLPDWGYKGGAIHG